MWRWIKYQLLIVCCLSTRRTSGSTRCKATQALTAKNTPEPFSHYVERIPVFFIFFFGGGGGAYCRNDSMYRVRITPVMQKTLPSQKILQSVFPANFCMRAVIVTHENTGIDVCSFFFFSPPPPPSYHLSVNCYCCVFDNREGGSSRQTA